MKYILDEKEFSELNNKKERYKDFYNEIFKIVSDDMSKRKYRKEETEYLPYKQRIYIFNKQESLMKNLYSQIRSYGNEGFFGAEFEECDK